MGRSMSDYVNAGKEIRDKLQEGVNEASDKGQEFEEVKEGLSDMPGGLDDDLQQMIKEAEEQGRDEAHRDIQDTVRNIIDKAKAESDTLSSDVQSKIDDDNSAISKLNSIRGKYGKSAIESAKSSIEQNAQTGSDLLSNLEQSQSEADDNVQRILDRL